MMNSPTICQYYVAKALEPVRKQFPNFLVIHYMDDIFFSAPSILETQQILDIAQQYLKDSGLIIAPAAAAAAAKSLQSCPTLLDPMGCSPPGFSIHGILQARVLEWGASALSEYCP